MHFQLPRRRRAAWKDVALFLALLSLALTSSLLPISASAQGSARSAGIIVLVNDGSPHYTDFQRLVQPYLDHFGMPYSVHNVRTTPIGPEIGTHALILIGHRGLDPTGTALDLAEQDYISAAVYDGTGLVNLDNDLSSDGNTPRYQFVQDIWGFAYKGPVINWGVTFVNSEEQPGITIDCTNDLHQTPVLTTTADALALDPTDGLWVEYIYPPRGIRAVFADADEEDHGLPVLRCYAGNLPNGTYEVSASLYTDNRRPSMRYYYGYDAANPKEYYVDTESGSGGEDRFRDYALGTVAITDGTFEIYAQDADLFTATLTTTYPLLDLYAQDAALMANPEILAIGHPQFDRTVQQQVNYPTITQTLTLFGWSSVRLTEVGRTSPPMPYITEGHWAGEWIGTGSMTVAGLGPLPEHVNVLAWSSSEPFLLTTTYGQGRAVQWGSYDWMSHLVKGPVRPLDDLVWRSVVWAARKPFAMQGMPPLLTMRVDDVSGPFGWLEVANEFGFKPWVGFFYGDIGPQDATRLSDLVHAGQATASVHAVHGDTFFYYDDAQEQDWPDAVMEARFLEATAWHTQWNIPISSYVVPHKYEFGTNVFQGLRDWGVEFVTTMTEPGTPYGSPWIQNGPFRRYESGNSDGGMPLYYADWIQVPGRAEFDGQFFNCATEIRDDGGYEWYPSNDILSSIGRGTRHAVRAFNSMAVATLMTHEPYIELTDADNWRAILQGITDNLAPYNVIHVTMDDACRYARAVATSDITGSSFSPISGQLTVEMSGNTDIPTMLYLFTESDGAIQSTFIDVPPFTDTAQLSIAIQPPSGSRLFLPLVVK